MFIQRIRSLAVTGLLCGALTAVSIGSAVAAPLGDNPAPPPTPPTTAAAAPTSLAAHPHRPIARLLRGVFKPITQLFGISGADLLKQLGQGQTLAQIAPRYGKSATDVQNAVLSALKTALDKRVAAGEMTAAHENQILANAPARVSKLVSADLSKFARRIERRVDRRQSRQPTPAAASAATGQ